MNGNAFDSNVILYALIDDGAKAAAATELLANGGTISVQVLNEIAAVVRRKARMPWPVIEQFLDNLEYKLRIVPVTHEVHREARHLAQRCGLAFYDAAIVAAALIAGCDTLWSEDMHDGLVVADRLTIRNPFTVDQV